MCAAGPVATSLLVLPACLCTTRQSSPTGPWAPLSKFRQIFSLAQKKWFQRSTVSLFGHQWEPTTSLAGEGVEVMKQQLKKLKKDYGDKKRRNFSMSWPQREANGKWQWKSNWFPVSSEPALAPTLEPFWWKTVISLALICFSISGRGYIQ